jgi:acetyl esterase/lipase
MAVALVILPSPGYLPWLARLVVLETSLGVAAAAALALLLAAPGLKRGLRSARLAGLVAVPVLVLAFLAFVVPLAAFGTHRVLFSAREYVTGRVGPPVVVLEDVRLDAPGFDLRADVYRPEGPAPGPFPLVVAVHGGSWRGGSKRSGTHLYHLLARTGYVVAAVNYRLAPEHPFPAAVADLKCAIGRLRERASELGLEPGRVGLLGRSAGGQISLVAAYTAEDPELPPSCAVLDRPVQAVAAIYAPLDLAWGYHHPMWPDVVRGPESLRLYLGGTPEERPRAYAAASPLAYAERGIPMTLIVHGTGDRLVSPEHARRFAARMRLLGRGFELLEVPLAEHGFDQRPGGVGEQLARAVLLRFLKDRL